MKYKAGRRFLGLRKLLYLRYRVYAICVIFFSVFIVNQDTTNAVKTLVPANSLTYKISNQNVFAKQIETYQGPESDKISKIIHRDKDTLYVTKSAKLSTGGEEYNKYKNYGYTFKTPAVDLRNFSNYTPEELTQIGVDPKLSNVNKKDNQPAELIAPPAPPELNDIIRAPANPERKNFIDFPKFNIKAPILYTAPSDVYYTNSDGTVDYNRPILDDPNAAARGNYTSTPLLRMLVDGVIHMGGIPGVPMPGELGNAYIAGHSSNYSSVQSPYNEVFAPLVDRVQAGDEFYVYDQQGRKLTFRIFGTDTIHFQDNPELAYKRDDPEYANRRIMTLQTCKSEWIPGQGWQPTLRYLVRAELVP